MSETQTYVYLNGVKLPIVAPVIWSKVTPFPDQLMTSAPGVADYTPTSKQTWGKLKGGLGVDKWTAEENDRYWDADGVDASINIQSLASLVTTMGAFGTHPVRIIKYANKIWAIGNNNISYWDTITSAWVAANPTPPLANPTDAITYYGST
jgi:hypothetical protein